MKPTNQRPSKYFNFGSAWLSDDQTMINCQVSWERNKKANKGQGYKLFLVPVDDTGEPLSDQAKEITKFRLKKVEPAQNAPNGIPDFSCYSWE